MDNIAEEFEFEYANYYAISKNGEDLSCKDQYYIADVEDDNVQSFL